MRMFLCLCLALAALAGSMPVNAQDQGRCCYTDPAGAPACAVTTQSACANLGGAWTPGVTCDVPCSSPCVTCAAGDLVEPEPCPSLPDTFNAGCTPGQIPRFIPIECGMAVCGQAWATPGGTVPGYVDRDAYMFTLPQDTFVSICVKAEYAVLVELWGASAAAPCPDTFIVRGEADTCEFACIERCLPAGTYHFYTQPVLGQTIECLPYRLVMHCAPCPQPCVVECPPNAIPENEPCPPTNLESDANGGCLRPPHLFQPIECGMTICGTSWLQQDVGAAALHDVDAYQVVVTAPTRLHFCVVAEFAPLVALLAHDDSCLTATLLDSAAGRPCDTVCVDTCVQPGVYDFYVIPRPGLNEPFLCHTYVAHLSCEPCCQSSRTVVLDAGQVPQCECVHFCPGTTVPIWVCGRTASPSRPPILIVTPGCFTPDAPGDGGEHCAEPCDPIPSSGLFFNNAGWVWNDSLHCWFNYIIGYAEGCACICLDGFLAVELQSFTAAPGDGRVTLNWQTASERENDHFEVMRDGHPAATNVRATNNPTGAHYSWTDRDLQNGRAYTYQLVAVDMGGIRTTLASTEATPAGGTAEVISEYALRQNYPNPFNPKTSISFDLVENGFVKLTVYNPMGQQVTAIVSSEMTAGSHTVAFDASNLPSGMYLYRLEVNGFSAVRKMLLMK